MPCRYRIPAIWISIKSQNRAVIGVIGRVSQVWTEEHDRIKSVNATPGPLSQSLPYLERRTTSIVDERDGKTSDLSEQLRAVRGIGGGKVSDSLGTTQNG